MTPIMDDNVKTVKQFVFANRRQQKNNINWLMLDHFDRPFRRQKAYHKVCVEADKCRADE